MISFWLLCWNMLRATAGLRKPAVVLTDSNHDNCSSSYNNPVNDSRSSVAMEISSSPLMTVLERESLCSWCNQEVEEVQYAEALEIQQPMEDKQEEEEADRDECDHLFFVIGKKEGKERERREKMEREGEGGDEEIMEEGGRQSADDGGITEDKERYEEGRGEDGETMGEMAELLFLADRPSSSPPELVVEYKIPEAHIITAGDDCFQAELAVVYSDSDTRDGQSVAFESSDVIRQEEAEEHLCDITSDRKDREEERGEDETEEQDTETERRNEYDEERMKLRTDLLSPISSTASSTDPDKRIPVDFCVYQDTISENVSTEHVDFVLACQQWRKMEEEFRGQPIPKPGLRAQESTYSTLYPPTRSPHLKHREIHPPPMAREPPLSSPLSPSSEDLDIDDASYHSPLEEPENAVEREIRLTLEREERHRRERRMVAQGLTIPGPNTLQAGQSPSRPPACRTTSLSLCPCSSSTSSLPRAVCHEMTANNVIILEPDCSGSNSRNYVSTAASVAASLDTMPSASVIVVETSNLIIRSASEFCLSSAPVSIEVQESTFTSNPFFKLRSLSSQSLVEREIRMVRQREEEWRRQREDIWRRRREEEWQKGRERYDTVLVSPGMTDSISYNAQEVPDRCVSSPSSPSRMCKIQRCSLSSDHKFPPSLSSAPQRQNTMAQRWEASLLANQKQV